MPVDIIRADNGQYSQLDGYIIVFLVMGKSVQCIDKQSEGDSVGYGTELIEFPVGTFFFSRQVLASQYQGCHEAMERMPLATEGPAAADMATTMALIPIPLPI